MTLQRATQYDNSVRTLAECESKSERLTVTPYAWSRFSSTVLTRNLFTGPLVLETVSLTQSRPIRAIISTYDIVFKMLKRYLNISCIIEYMETQLPGPLVS